MVLACAPTMCSNEDLTPLLGPVSQGLDLAGHLLQQTMAELRRELPNLDKFSTLSPMPKFLAWWKANDVRMQACPGRRSIP